VAASGTLVVTSDTGMPLTGTFRLRLGNLAGTILRVDSRVGTTLTVTADEDDGNAAVGDSVSLVVTAEALLQLKADAIAGGGGGFFDFLPTRVPVVGADYAWDNQGASTVVNTAAISYLTAAPGGGTQRRLRLKTQPATPYVITAGMIPRLRIVNGFDCGISFRESGTAKHASIGIFGFNAGLRAIRGTAANNYTAEMAAIANLFLPAVMFLRLSNDGATLTFSYSTDGQNFRDLFSEGLTGSFTTAPDQVAYYVNNEDGTITASASFVHWEES
jgi:hypothetical protein